MKLAEVFILRWLVRVTLVLLLGVAILHFMENPVGISIICGGLIVLVFSSRDDVYLIVNRSQIIYRKSTFGLWNKDEIIEIALVEQLDVFGNYTQSLDLLSLILPGNHIFGPNTIQIKLKNGQLKKIELRIYKHKLIKLKELIEGIQLC